MNGKRHTLVTKDNAFSILSFTYAVIHSTGWLRRKCINKLSSAFIWSHKAIKPSTVTSYIEKMQPASYEHSNNWAETLTGITISYWIQIISLLPPLRTPSAHSNHPILVLPYDDDADDDDDNDNDDDDTECPLNIKHHERSEESPLNMYW